MILEAERSERQQQQLLLGSPPQQPLGFGALGQPAALFEGLQGLKTVRTLARTSSSLGPDSPRRAQVGPVPVPAATPFSSLLDSFGAKELPQSPASAEGRLKKYRRSECELRISIAHRVRPLHNSADMDDLLQGQGPPGQGSQAPPTGLSEPFAALDTGPDN